MGFKMALIEEEYKKIGKAVIRECMARADEESISITLRAVQVSKKLYIRMEDKAKQIAIFDFSDLFDIAIANRQQRAREREAVDKIETIIIELPPKSKERELPKVVIVE